MDQAIRGRTFFNDECEAPDAEAWPHTLCFTLQPDSVPANAQLFGDIAAQVVPLRVFAGMCLHLWSDSDKARARICWDATGRTCLVVHFSAALGEDSATFAGALNEALLACIKADVRRLTRRRGECRWKASELLLDRDQWSHVSGHTLWPINGPLALDPYGPRSATLLRMHLREECLWHKLLPHQQEYLYPDAPFSGNEPPDLRRWAATVPLPPSACRLSEWEVFLQRAELMRRREDPDQYRAWAVRQLSCTLQGELSGYVPPPERCLNELPMGPLTVPWAFQNLSSFGALVVHLMQNFDTFGFMFSQHIVLLKAFIGALDVYLEKKPGSLHYSMMLAGPAASSKSFTLTLLTSMLVKGSVSVATRRTANSKSYDTDAGSAIDIEHEMTREFFGQGTVRNSNPRGAQTKDVLTAHEFVTEACHCTDDGRRVQIISRSRCHRGLFCATNDFATGGADSNDHALLSRFDVIFPTMTSARKDLLSVMVREKDPTHADEAGFEAFTTLTRRLQVCTYWVLRLISGKALRDVDFSALKLVLSEVCLKLNIRAPPARTTERIFSLARVATVLTALAEEFALPGAPRHGETPTVQSVACLQSRLVCTAEIAKFCIELQRSELENTHDLEIAEALRSISCVPHEDDSSYVAPKGVSRCDDFFKQVSVACGAGSGVSPEVVAQWLGALSSRKIRDAPRYRPVGPGDPQSAIGVVVDDGAPRGTALGCKFNCYIHASVVEQRNASAALSTTLAEVCRSALHDEITATPQHQAPHRLKVRPCQKEAKPSNHVMLSGLYVTQSDWLALGQRQPTNDAERQFRERRICEHVETYVKRPRLTPPAHAVTATYGGASAETV